MDWSNERYVRLYTRDTIDWCLWPWQARAVFPLLLRKMDRSGSLAVGNHGAAGIAELVRMPVDVVQVGLDSLVRDGCVTLRDGVVTMKNYVEAQESKASDALRAKNYRERAKLSSPVTPRDEPITKRDVSVTDRHAPSQTVTPSLAVPSLAEPVSPAAREATDSQNVEAQPSPEQAPPSKPRAQKQQKPHTPSAQEQIAQALAATRTRIHPDLTPWPVAEARFIKVVNKVFAAGSDIRTAHDADPKTFQAAWERFLADPYWKANGGWPLTGFLAKWREHLDSAKATQPSASFRNAIRPGEAFPDPYAEEETDHG